MIFLSFSNACKFFFTIFLLFVFSSDALYSQTRIKERVGINPEEKKKLLRLNKTNSTESLWVQVSGQFGWSAVLEGPCGVNSTASGNNGTIKYISVSNPPVGTYRLRITQYFPGAVPGEQGPGGEVSYAAGYTGFSRDSASFSYGSSFQWAIGQTSRTSEFTFNLNYRNDFVVYTNGSVCTYRTQDLILYSYSIQDCSKTTFFNSSDSVHLSIKNNNADLVFYDNSAGLSLGKNTTAATAQLSSIVLKLNSPFYGAAESDTLTAVFNGVLRSSTVLVEPSTKNFSLTADDNFHVVHGFSKTVNVAASPIGDCNEPFPDPSVKYNLEIINGIQHGNLKNIFNGNVGKTLRNIDQIEGRMKFQFIADGDIPVSEEIITVRISASSPDITGRDISFFVNSNDIFVTFLPQSIKPKDTTDVILKMRDSTGAVVDFPENQLFDLEISDGINYGDLLYKYRNWFWVSAKHLQSVYAPFKFVAIDTTLSGSIQSTVLVSTNKDGNTLWGEAAVTIGEELKLKINLTGDKEVWPYKAVGAGYNSITNIKIKVTNGEQPMANQRVKITIKRKEMSGGHDHPNSLNQALWGRISVNGVKGNPVITNTDQNGEIKTQEIRSSEFGGEYFIEANLVTNPGINDKVGLIVRVPELVPLETSSYYELVGSPNNHSGTNDPCRTIPPNSDHYTNHFGTQGLVSSLINLSSEHIKKYPSIKLRINDMSLRYGGLFDWKNNWKSPHGLHRLGKNADIGYMGIGSNNRCVAINKRFLLKLIKDFTHIDPLEESDHFHVYTM